VGVKALEDYRNFNVCFRISESTEFIVEVRFMSRSLDVDLDVTKLMPGDNMSVVLNDSVPSRVLKKRHNAIAYHYV
jgi:hypothetical protein